MILVVAATEFELEATGAAVPVQLLDVEQHRLDLERRLHQAVHERVERERVVRARREAEGQRTQSAISSSSGGTI